MDYFDPVILARIQFAFTISFHILFPAFTIGLASWLALTEFLWLYTKKPVYKEIYRFWVKIFAVTFAMGVVSGVVMSYQFGTNWSVFSYKVGNILGPLLGYEVLTAFFLEASFLGIMLFGWGKVSEKMHFFATLIVAIGTLISAFWILSANSWMHTPAGYSVGDNGVLYPTNWVEIIFNPSFVYRYVHMLTAAYLTTAFIVAGVSSYYLLNNRFEKHARVMFAHAMIMAIFVTPIQPILGDLHGLNTLKYQPVKVAAMEGIWETEKGAGLRVFAIPNNEAESNSFEISIPYLSSLILTHDINGEVKGLKEWKKEDRPNVPMVFYMFRVMVGIGMLMMLTGFIAVVLYFRGKLFSTKNFFRWCIFMSPMGLVAIEAGWFVTETGRQPFLAYGLLRTKDMISPVIGSNVAFSLMMFVIVYALVFGAGIYYIFKLINKGVKIDDIPFGSHNIDKSVIIDQISGGKHA